VRGRVEEVWTLEVRVALLYARADRAHLKGRVDFGIYARVRVEGAVGLSLATSSVARGVGTAVIVIGIAFMVAAFAPRGYWDSPVAVLGAGVRPAMGLERVTRHPFFTGTVLVMGTHAALAEHLTGTVFFAGSSCLQSSGPSTKRARCARAKGPRTIVTSMRR